MCVLLVTRGRDELVLPPLPSPCSLVALQYYTDPESVMEKVGIGLDGQKTASLKDSEKLECRICCEEFTGKDAYALACNHFFCRGCWAAYLNAKVNINMGIVTGAEFVRFGSVRVGGWVGWWEVRLAAGRPLVV